MGKKKKKICYSLLRGENAADVRDNVRRDNDNRKGRGGPPPVSDSARTQ